MKSHRSVGWSNLPSELLITIAGNLTEFTDHLRLRSVCSHWRSSFHSHSASLRLPPQLPWLALPSTFSNHFYSLSEDRVYPNPPPNVSDNSHLFGSASGWFLSVDDRNHEITFSLINPFTDASIKLPSPDPCGPCWPLTDFVADTLVWDHSDSVVVVASTTRLGMYYCRLGEAAWASIESEEYSLPGSITFYEGRFYILRIDTYETVVLDEETFEEINMIDAPDMNYPVEAHLSVSYGELLLLTKHSWTYGDDNPDSGSQFYEVQRANFNDELVEWIEVYDIGDRALFVDNLHCFSVKVGNNSLLRRNCIYLAQSILAQLETSGGSKSSLMTYSISIFDLGNSSEEHLEGALGNSNGERLEGALGNSSGEHLEGALSKFLAASSHAASSRITVSPPSWILPSLS